MTKKQTPVLLSIAYLAPISWFACLPEREVFLESNETFPKQTYRNRCHIYSEKGLLSLSIPVTKPFGNHSLTSAVGMFNQDKWYLRHWRSIQSAYEASPYFLFYKDELQSFYQGNYNNLFDFDKKLILIITELIGLKTSFRLTETYEKFPENIIDCRNIIHPKKTLHEHMFHSYIQVFADRHGFLPNLSILDLLFNMGPESKAYLECLSAIINQDMQS